MAPITEDVVRHLAGFKGDGVPVTSCYLDVDGRRYVRPQDYELQLDVMIRQKRDRGPGGKSVDADLGRIEQFVKRGLDRATSRAVARPAERGLPALLVDELVERPRPPAFGRRVRSDGSAG